MQMTSIETARVWTLLYVHSDTEEENIHCDEGFSMHTLSDLIPFTLGESRSRPGLKVNTL